MPLHLLRKTPAIQLMHNIVILFAQKEILLPYLAVLGGGHSSARGQREKCKCLFLSSHDPAKQRTAWFTRKCQTCLHN